MWTSFVRYEESKYKGRKYMEARDEIRFSLIFLCMSNLLIDYVGKNTLKEIDSIFFFLIDSVG